MLTFKERAVWSRFVVVVNSYFVSLLLNDTFRSRKQSVFWPHQSTLAYPSRADSGDSSNMAFVDLNHSMDNNNIGLTRVLHYDSLIHAHTCFLQLKVKG